MTKRSDMSDKLIHFTKGSLEDAYASLCRIMAEKRLIGSDGYIKGGYACVCFTEAPLGTLVESFIHSPSFRYQPFGLMFDKRFIYGLGGRPVIYQHDSEYDLLPPQSQWRHVRYEPDIVDFTWEREWRLHAESLMFESPDVAIVVPDEGWEHRLLSEHELAQDSDVLLYSTVMEHGLAELYREAFPWKVTRLLD